VTTATRRAEVDAYLAGVAAALADLPSDDRQDLLDELSTHLDELSQETDAPLESRLGTPAAYAAELRASAGLPPVGVRQNFARRWFARISTALIPALDRPGVRSASEFLVSLRAVWWVLRAWVLVAALALLTERQTRWSTRLIVVPRVVNGATGLCLTVAAIVISVQLARHRLGVGRMARNMSLLVNAVAVLALLPTLFSLVAASENTGCCISYQTVEQVPAHGVYAGGEQVRNIYAYDGAGKLVTDLRLYDEHGRPLDLDLLNDANRRVLFDSTGAAVQNTYPIRYFEPGTRTVTSPFAAPNIVVPPLVVQPMTTPGATVDTASPQPTPSTKR
jgi:hypothetical protein